MTDLGIAIIFPIIAIISLGICSVLEKIIPNIMDSFYSNILSRLLIALTVCCFFGSCFSYLT